MQILQNMDPDKMVIVLPTALLATADLIKVTRGKTAAITQEHQA